MNEWKLIDLKKLNFGNSRSEKKDSTVPQK